jgi:hypothetical protein
LSHFPEKVFDRLTLHRLGPEAEAGLCMASLPLPRGVSAELTLGERATFARPLGQWWSEAVPAPRGVLLIAAGGETPAELKPVPGATAKPTAAPPTAAADLFARSDNPELHWERHALSITWNGRRIELAMGMRVGQELRWWEACRLVVLSRTEVCCEVEMAGSIPHVIFEPTDLKTSGGYSYPFLHKHHWLSGHIYARLHANGVCEVFAHHVNSRFVDDGLPLDNAVPVVGFRAAAAADEDAWEAALARLLEAAHPLGVPGLGAALRLDGAPFPEPAARATLGRSKMLWSYLRSSLGPDDFDPTVLRARTLGELLARIAGRGPALLTPTHAPERDWIYAGGRGEAEGAKAADSSARVHAASQSSTRHESSRSSVAPDAGSARASSSSGRL